MPPIAERMILCTFRESSGSSSAFLSSSITASTSLLRPLPSSRPNSFLSLSWPGLFGFADESVPPIFARTINSSPGSTPRGTCVTTRPPPSGIVMTSSEPGPEPSGQVTRISSASPLPPPPSFGPLPFSGAPFDMFASLRFAAAALRSARRRAESEEVSRRPPPPPLLLPPPLLDGRALEARGVASSSLPDAKRALLAPLRLYGAGGPPL